MLEEVTDADVTVTEVRVEQTEDGSVDTTGYMCSKLRMCACIHYRFLHTVYSTDIVFFTVQRVDSKVISPHTVIRYAISGEQKKRICTFQYSLPSHAAIKLSCKVDPMSKNQPTKFITFLNMYNINWGSNCQIEYVSLGSIVSLPSP